MSAAVKYLVDQTDEQKLASIVNSRQRLYNLYNSTRVKYLRARLGLSVRDFASWVGVCTTTIYAWQKGRTPSHLAQRALYQLDQYFFSTTKKRSVF